MTNTLYTMEPAPRANPRGELMGSWVVKREGKIVARFQSDGRDRAESWIRAKPLLYGCPRDGKCRACENPAHKSVCCWTHCKGCKLDCGDGRER